MRRVFAKEAREDQNAEVKAERLVAATGHHLEGRDCSPSAEKYVHIVLAMEVREGPTTQETALCLMVATGHPFEVMTSTYRQPSIAGDVAGPSSNTQWAFQQLWRKQGVELHQQSVHRQRKALALCWRLAYTFCNVG